MTTHTTPRPGGTRPANPFDPTTWPAPWGGPTGWGDWPSGWGDAWRQLVEQSQQAADPMWTAWWQGVADPGAALRGGVSSPHARHHRLGHRHHAWQGRHQHDGCPCGCGDTCECCVPDADVVVNLRAYERRVVPFLLRNERHRERTVTVGIGTWTDCGDPLEVAARLVPEGEITLQPCEEQVVRLLVAAVPGAAKGDDPAKTPVGTVAVRADSLLGAAAAGGRRGAATVDQPPGVVDLPDVPRCASAYTDVRFEGCAGPLRVAVVVHPLTCDAVDVDCGCDCCC